MKIERRSFPMEVRVADKDGKKKIEAHAAVFDTLSKPIADWFREKVAKGAFTNALLHSDTRALFNHEPSMILGRKSANTLTVYEDERGLKYEIDPPNTSYANDLLVSIERGDVKESSFGFTVKREEWVEPSGPGEYAIRTILEVDELYDVSPATFPAYPDANDVHVRSAKEVFDEHVAASKQVLSAADIEAKRQQVLRLEASRRERDLVHARVWLETH